MFTRYDYKAGSLAVNIVADIVALLTGTTDKATLSTDCVQATTVIINDGVTRPAGWTVFDSAAAIRSVAIRAPNFDETTYKYVVVNHNNTSTLYLKTYESWNATTHVGTNQTTDCDVRGTTVGLTNGGTLFISSSARGIIMIGVNGGVYDPGPIMVMEHSRDEPWDTPALNIPPTVFTSNLTFGAAGNTSGGSAAFQKCRMRVGGVDITSGNAWLAAILPFGGGTNIANMSPTTKVRDVNYNSVHAFCPIMLASAATPSGSQEALVGGKIFDIFVTTKSYGTSGDEVIFNTKPYFIIAAGGTTSLNGVTRLAIPKF